MSKINKYKLKNNYYTSLNKFIKELNNDEQKIINQDGSYSNGNENTGHL